MSRVFDMMRTMLTFLGALWGLVLIVGCLCLLVVGLGALVRFLSERDAGYDEALAKVRMRRVMGALIIAMTATAVLPVAHAILFAGTPLQPSLWNRIIASLH